MKTLILQEIIIQNRVYNLFKYTLMFFMFCSLAVTMINSYDNIRIFGVVFSVIAIPLAFLNLSANLVKPDIEDGTLEVLLISNSASAIIVAKYISVCFCCFLSFLMISPVIYLIYNMSLFLFSVVVVCSFMVIFLSGALTVLIASMQGYFRSNTNFLSILIMPIIIPSIILSGIVVQHHSEIYYLFIMLGINLIIIPPVLYLSSHLIDNIYNI